MEWLKAVFSSLLVKIIRFYQATLSPDHGWLKARHPFGYCRFQPTCSEYAIDAINKYGPLKGLIKTIWRLLRCNPFNKGGYDPA